MAAFARRLFSVLSQIFSAQAQHRVPKEKAALAELAMTYLGPSVAGYTEGLA